jgi:hypothetical protein
LAFWVIGQNNQNDRYGNQTEFAATYANVLSPGRGNVNGLLASRQNFYELILKPFKESKKSQAK